MIDFRKLKYEKFELQQHEIFYDKCSQIRKKKKLVEWLAKIVKGTGLSYLTFIRK